MKFNTKLIRIRNWIADLDDDYVHSEDLDLAVGENPLHQVMDIITSYAVEDNDDSCQYAIAADIYRLSKDVAYSWMLNGAKRVPLHSAIRIMRTLTGALDKVEALMDISDCNCHLY